jgi:hypothetical protein
MHSKSSLLARRPALAPLGWGGGVDPAGGNRADYQLSNHQRDYMKGKGPREERETIINFNEAEPYAAIWTASQPMYRKLLKLGYEPIEGSDRSATFEVPKRLVAIRRPRKISEAHRTTLAEKARSMRSSTVITEGNGADEPQQ